MSPANQLPCPGSFLISSAYGLSLMIHKGLPSTEAENKTERQRETHKKQQSFQ